MLVHVYCKYIFAIAKDAFSFSRKLAHTRMKLDYVKYLKCSG